MIQLLSRHSTEFSSGSATVKKLLSFTPQLQQAWMQKQQAALYTMWQQQQLQRTNDEAAAAQTTGNAPRPPTLESGEQGIPRQTPLVHAPEEQ
ncbi:hypothetical protein PsYK624_080030 [Phanerochaete sordida]|uniref:Uncharacterized protein n=1 Tax=Phanerochaete sordida TaxID=48140 RepID=A0A9P3G9R1_9APHY|nr:hypothetical protein PsYK624_080030 [Phanerochaete sordida]